MRSLSTRHSRGKKQLHTLEVERIGKIANIRIHVKRVSGLIVRKFRIFDGEIPLESLKLRLGDSTLIIDRIVPVCCCFTNLCPSVVSVY